jgi:hypothetical protein
MNDDSKRAKISAAVDADSDKAIALLRDMVTSVTGEEARIQRYLQHVRYGMCLIVDMWEVDWSKLRGIRAIDRSIGVTKVVRTSWLDLPAAVAADLSSSTGTPTPFQ